MILTVTLNPAVDKIYETGELIRGQVNRMRSVSVTAGGKGINVTKILRQFGQPVMAMGFLGGYTGKMIGEAMEKQGALSRFTQVEGETRTTINILADTGYVTELLEPGPSISAAELQRFEREFASCLPECSLVALCGSVPEGVPEDFYGGLIQQCRQAGKQVILDTSGELLKESVKAAPDVVKPNRKEMEYLTGRKLRDAEDILEGAGSLLELGVKKIVVTLGEHGLYYVDRESHFYMPAPEVHAVNTVGCGDSVVASLCMSLQESEEPEKAMHRALALSCANAATSESGRIPMDIYQELLGSSNTL